MPPCDFSLVTSTCCAVAVPLVAGAAFWRPARVRVSCWRVLAIGDHTSGEYTVQNFWFAFAASIPVVYSRTSTKSFAILTSNRSLAAPAPVLFCQWTSNWPRLGGTRILSDG